MNCSLLPLFHFRNLIIPRISSFWLIWRLALFFPRIIWRYYSYLSDLGIFFRLFTLLPIFFLTNTIINQSKFIINRMLIQFRYISKQFTIIDFALIFLRPIFEPSSEDIGTWLYRGILFIIDHLTNHDRIW